MARFHTPDPRADALEYISKLPGNSVFAFCLVTIGARVAKRATGEASTCLNRIYCLPLAAFGSRGKAHLRIVEKNVRMQKEICVSIRILYECASLCDCVCGSATDAKEEVLKLQLLSWALRSDCCNASRVILFGSSASVRRCCQTQPRVFLQRDVRPFVSSRSLRKSWHLQQTTLLSADIPR